MRLSARANTLPGVLGRTTSARPTPALDTSARGLLKATFARTGVRVGLIYALLAAIADFPIYPGDPAKVPSLLGEDIYQTTWFLEWTPHAILHGQNLFTTNLINYPYGVDLAQNTGIPLLGLLSAPLTLTAGPVASMNLLRWMAFWLSAYAAFAVLRRWNLWAPAAFAGGLLYGFSPYMVAQGSVHLNLIFVPLPPVIFYLCYEVCISQHFRALRSGLLLGLVCAAQYYISAEILATTFLVVAIAGFFLFFACIKDVPLRIRHAVVGLGSAALLLGILVGYPTWMIFHGPEHYVGPAQGYNNVYNADLLGQIIPTANQLVSPARLRQIGSTLVGNNLQENGSYLGIPLVVLLVVVVVRYWRRLWTVFAALMALTVSALALGPFLVINGKRHRLPFSLPFRKIDHLPLISNVLPVRLSLYIAFFAAVVVAIGIDAFHNDMVERRILLGSRSLPASVILGRAITGVLVVAAVVALVPNWPYRSFKAAPNATERPSALSIIPAGSVVLAYPYPTPFSDEAMLWQALDQMRFRLLGSYALVRGHNGRASVIPAILKPAEVEAMLIDSITPTPVGGLPELVATAHDIKAVRVIVEKAGAARPHDPVPSDVVGKVASVSPEQHRFVIDVSATTPVGVLVSSSTVYLEAHTRRPSLAGLAPGKWVIVSGQTVAGSVTPALVVQLRDFLRVNHVNAIVDDLGLRDSWEVGLWFRAAIGLPNRSGGGGEIWTDVQQRLARLQ